MSVRVLVGDCRDVLATLPDASVQCVVTSPPYANLRDYGHPDQIGAEATAEEYIAELVNVFRLVRRVLRDDGTLWLNLGDGMADKQLRMIPARVALALQADAWVLRSDKRASYFYDSDAVREPAVINEDGRSRYNTPSERRHAPGDRNDAERTTSIGFGASAAGRNLRNVWTIATQPYSGAHFATMPPDLAERCIKAGTRPGDTVLDPFGGAGTTALVADRLGRNAVIVELNPAYAELARDRVRADAPLFAEVAA